MKKNIVQAGWKLFQITDSNAYKGNVEGSISKLLFWASCITFWYMKFTNVNVLAWKIISCQYELCKTISFGLSAQKPLGMDHCTIFFTLTISVPTNSHNIKIPYFTFLELFIGISHALFFLNFSVSLWGNRW